MITYTTSVSHLVCSNQDPLLPMAINTVLVEWLAEDTEWAVTATVSMSLPLGMANTGTFIPFNILTENQVIEWVDQEIRNSDTWGVGIEWPNEPIGEGTYVTSQLNSQLEQARKNKNIIIATPPWTTSTNTASTVSNQDSVATDPVMIETPSDPVVEPDPVVVDPQQ